MKDFQQQLKEYKKEHFRRPKIEWTEEDVKELLYTGSSKNHPKHSSETQLTFLRTPNHAMRNRFIKVIKEYERETGNKVEPFYTRRFIPTEQELELISKHIVPFGISKDTCRNIAAKFDMIAKGTKTFWAFENKKEYEERTGKPVIETEPEPEQEPAVESFADEVKRQPQTDFELKTEAFKTLFVGGMPIEKISKVLGLDDKVTNAMMVVIDHFKL